MSFGLVGAFLLALVIGGCGARARGDSRSVVAAETRARFHPPSSFEAYLRAEIAFDRGDFDLAVQEFNEALASSDEDPYVLSRLIVTLRRAGESEKAERRLARGLQNHPNSIELRELANRTSAPAQAQRDTPALEPSFGDEAIAVFFARGDWDKLRTALLAVSPSDPNTALLRVRAWSALAEYELAYGQAVFVDEATHETYCAAVLSEHFEDAARWAPSDEARTKLARLLVGPSTTTHEVAATIAGGCLR